MHADVLLHVLDVGHPRAQQQYDSVHEVLAEIGVTGKPEILLLNKTDTPEGGHAADVWLALRPDAIAISARTGRGLERLNERVHQFVLGTQSEVTLRADVTDGGLLAFLERATRIQDRVYENGTVQIRTIVGRRTLDELRRNDAVKIEHVEPLGTAAIA